MRFRLRYLIAALPVLIIGVVVVALIVLWLRGVPWRVSGASQPVAFPHPVHISAAQLQCQYCHRGAENGPNAWVPSVELCMGCHSTIVTKDPNSRAGQEIAKVRNAWATNQPIEWTKIHQMPNHVHFTHQPHIQKGFDCSVCHGDVAKMTEVSQVRSLRMGDCIACHRANGGTTDCFKCHY
jgi:Cytochrome c7 and related cytochrome c